MSPEPRPTTTASTSADPTVTGAIASTATGTTATGATATGATANTASSPVGGEPFRPGPQVGPEHILRIHAAVLAAADPAGRQHDPLAALHLVGEVRGALDETERRLIETAREGGASWSRIATALGLGSRQAAEQRWLRLCGDLGRDPARVRTARVRQQTVDAQYGGPTRDLRATVCAVHRELSGAPGWDELHPSARLARTTLALAGKAEGGGLFALATQAADDLDAVPSDRLPRWARATLARLRQAILAATPPRTTPRTPTRADGPTERPG